MAAPKRRVIEMCHVTEKFVIVGISVCKDDLLENVPLPGDLLLNAKLIIGLLCDALMRLVIGIGRAEHEIATVLPWLESLGALANDKNYRYS